MGAGWTLDLTMYSNSSDDDMNPLVGRTKLRQLIVTAYFTEIDVLTCFKNCGKFEKG